MKYWEAFKVAIRALMVNKLRSFLTMLGIIIGVAAVITLLAVGQGVQDYITQQLQGIGTNLLFVIPGSMEEGPSTRGLLPSLTYDDAQALLDPYKAPDVVAVSPVLLGAESVSYGKHARRFSVLGVEPDYLSVRNLRLASGRFFTKEDLLSNARVTVLGSKVADDLFEGEDPVGKKIRVGNILFRVVGTLESKGGMGSNNVDEQLYVPLTTASERLFPNMKNSRGERLVSLINVQVTSEFSMDRAREEVSEILRERHNIKLGDEDDFTVISQKDLLNIFGDITRILTLFLGAIAAISLLVGGIGIMNIMLVSVTERTREIGIRKAVGAKKRDILLQFLIEATTLSLLGGVVGILLGVGGAMGVSAAIGSFHATVTVSAVALATGFSIAVGLFFGIYPASRAASLNPIEALRYE